MRNQAIQFLTMAFFASTIIFGGCSKDTNSTGNEDATYFFEATYRGQTYRFETKDPENSYSPESMECRINEDPTDFYSGAYIEFETPTSFSDADVLGLKGKDIPYNTFENVTEIEVEIYIFTPEAMSTAWSYPADHTNSNFMITDVKKLSPHVLLPAYDRYEVSGTFESKAFDSPDEYPLENGSFKILLIRSPF